MLPVFIHVILTNKIPFLQSRASGSLIAASLLFRGFSAPADA